MKIKLELPPYYAEVLAELLSALTIEKIEGLGVKMEGENSKDIDDVLLCVSYILEDAMKGEKTKSEKAIEQMQEVLLWLAKREVKELPNPHYQETEDISLDLWNLIYNVDLRGWGE